MRRLRDLNPRFQCPKKHCRAIYDIHEIECPECGHSTPRIVTPSEHPMTLAQWCDWVDRQAKKEGES